MANTGHFRGANVSFRLQDISGASCGLTGDGNSFELTHSNIMADSTPYADTHMVSSVIGDEFAAEFAGYWAGSGADSAASKLHALVGASAGTWFQANPAGSANSDVVNYSACVNLEEVEVQMQAIGLIQFAFSLVPRSGSLTISTASW